MRYLFLILFTVSLNAQILPSQQATHYKKNSVPSDTWDSSTKASCITLSNSNLTSLESNCTRWNNVYGSTGVSSGIKEWEITIDAWDDTSNNYDVMIGVSKLRTQNPVTAVGNGSYC